MVFVMPVCSSVSKTVQELSAKVEEQLLRLNSKAEMQLTSAVSYKTSKLVVTMSLAVLDGVCQLE